MQWTELGAVVRKFYLVLTVKAKNRFQQPPNSRVELFKANKAAETYMREKTLQGIHKAVGHIRQAE